MQMFFIHPVMAQIFSSSSQLKTKIGSKSDTGLLNDYNECYTSKQTLGSVSKTKLSMAASPYCL